jgi:hypothetical protein
LRLAFFFLRSESSALPKILNVLPTNEYTGNGQMVYCTKCGTKNPDDATVCSQCGAPLYAVGEAEGQRRVEGECFGPSRRSGEPYRRVERECFGLPRGGAIVGIVIGLIILMAGLILFLRQWGVIPGGVDVWPFVAIIFGILIVIGALYGLRRRY